MKTSFIGFLIFIAVCTNATEINTSHTIRFNNENIYVLQQDTTLAYLLSLSLASFEQKPVDSLLSQLPTTYIRRSIIGMGNLKVANYLP